MLNWEAWSMGGMEIVPFKMRHFSARCIFQYLSQAGTYQTKPTAIITNKIVNICNHNNHIQQPRADNMQQNISQSFM